MKKMTIIKSKRKRFVRNRSMFGSTIRSCKALTKARTTKKLAPKPCEEITEPDTLEEEFDYDLMDEDSQDVHAFRYLDSMGVLGNFASEGLALDSPS